ncbi:MAG: MBL fold metallo-hydrolase [Deltaproteobacteria bacterium]|nr:MBL fold metallo-hydrolase [Deltaproteobacteria bacterium]
MLGPRARRWLRRILITLASLAGVLAILAGGLVVSTWKVTGARATGERLARMQASPRWQDGRFNDTLPRQEPQIGKAALAYFTKRSKYREPDDTPPTLQRSATEFEAPPRSGLRVTWLGHSTLLVEIDGQRVLVDPVWGERASPFSWAGPRRFYAPPLPLAELPPLDAVVISHDHYDHLDMPTIEALAPTGVLFVVPLGVGAHLESWGVAPDRIVELDWWGEHRVGELRLVATPARHFSGRSPLMLDKDQTLWAGWALLGPRHRVFFSGDSAMFPGFAEIGARLGPFDLTMLESGAYNALWADVHMGPEQAVAAHRMLRGDVLLPVHWGLFDLSFHGWTEPVERILAAAAPHGIRVATPQPGQSLEPAGPLPTARWWPELPWQTAEEAPVVSSGLGGLATLPARTRAADGSALRAPLADQSR